MIPTQTFESFPVFGDTATKVKPVDAKYAAGWQPSDVYPAENVNWFWEKSSKGVSDLNAGTLMIEQEINNVLDGASKTPDSTKNNQLLESINKLISDAKAQAILAAHPIGSLYWSSQSTDPGTIFGGTWQRIKDKFILAAGDTYSNGATGGSATVTLTTQQIPSHTHTFSGSAVTSGNNSRGHTHSVTAAGTISVTTNPTFTGSAVSTGGMSANETHRHDEIQTYVGGTNYAIGYYARNYPSGNINPGLTIGDTSVANKFTTNYASVAHNHTVTAAGTISGGAYKFTGSSVTSGDVSQTHTHSVTAAGSNSDTGGGQSHDNMPPYLVKYCWERTA